MRPLQLGKSTWVVTLATVTLVVGILYLARGVLIPFTLAILASFVLAPVCDRLEQWKIGRVPAVIATTGIVSVVLGLVLWSGVAQLSHITSNLPQYQSNFAAKLTSLNGFVSSSLGKIAQSIDEIDIQMTKFESVDGGARKSETGEESRSPYPVRLVNPPVNPLVVASQFFGSLVEVLGTTGVVVVFVVFFLLRREDLRDRFIRLVGHGQLGVTTQALNDAATRVSKYLLTQLLLNVAYGATVSVCLSLIGLPAALLWGLMAALFRFVPYIGPWIAALLPISLSLAIADGWTQPLLTTILFVGLELTSNMILEPWLYGSRTGVSPVAVLLSAAFWTWLWGGPGLLLATPLTVCLVVIGKHVPQFGFLNVLLGDEPVFQLRMRVYQRLLAGDLEEATELIDKNLDESSLADVYDTVLIPALALAEKDRHAGDLDENRGEFILQSLSDLVDELGDRSTIGVDSPLRDAPTGLSSAAPSFDESTAGRAGPEVTISVICLPARDRADFIVGDMLKQLLEHHGYSAATVSVNALTNEKVDLVEQGNADLICVSAVPPSAIAHTRYLCKRLRARFPETTIVVGLWGDQGDLVKTAERLGCGPGVKIVRTLSEAFENFRTLAQSVAYRRPTTSELSSDVKPLAPTA